MLQDLGFSEIEARIYAHLVGHSPSTGYRVSHAIGKPTANTYKAIAELARRGAVQVDDGGSGQVRAVPVEELLAQLERQARERRRAAEDALKDLESPGQDDRIYTLTATRQVLERARAMIDRATQIIVADMSPGPFAELRPNLVKAAGRKVVVAAKVYEEVAPVHPVKRPRPAPLDLVMAVNAIAVREAWPGQQLSLVVDAREHLLALLSDDLETVHQAVWSNSTFLSCMHHNHVAVEIELTRRDRGKMERSLPSTLLLHSRPPGLADLQRRYAHPGESAPAAVPSNRPRSGGPR